MVHKLLGGIFVGGRSSRMGVSKGLLAAPSGDGTLVEHAANVLRSVGAEVVLVGLHDDYRTCAHPVIEDAYPGIGPLGGLVALLERGSGGHVLACACDMPYVTTALARRLVDAPPAAAVTPVAGGVLQPLFARYDSTACLPVARRIALDARAGGSPALQRLLRELDAVPLRLSPSEERWLEDWDTPADVRAATARGDR